MALSFNSCKVLNIVKKKEPTVATSVAAIPKDSVKTTVKTPKKFAEFIKKDAKADSGLLIIYKQEDKYILEIPDSMLNREILIVSRISGAAAEFRNPKTMMGYAGDQINNNLIRLEKGPNHKLFIRSLAYGERARDSTAMMYKSLAKSSVRSIIASFDIKAFSKDGKGIIIDFTDYLNGDNNVLFFGIGEKQKLTLGGLQPDKSYIKEVRSYPLNIEIKTVKTYGFGEIPLTYELNTSIVLLPSNKMRERKADPRVGYFTTGYRDFEADPQGVVTVTPITRWRLEPRSEDVQRYLAGELVQPAKQIVFYIDPATPKNWVPYLMQGVNDWNVAFEQAGFKNAILAKEAPTKEQDSTWSIDDARHSAIVYKASDIPNASGPHVNDPRTGEILETHVNWYHNVMQLLKNWYFIQTAAVDPRARKPKMDEALMGQLIRLVSSHEVGHTLGLRHNFGSSSTVPVEKLRDKAWLEKNGHTPSIMDYARFNYVAQPEDGITEAGIFPRIGDYDKWAIEWAYRWYPEDRFKSADEEKAYLNRWVIARTSANKRLWFGAEDKKTDPRSQSEDLGDDAILASEYGIKNLKRTVPNILKWSKIDNEGYDLAKDRYRELLSQFNRYMGHVLRSVGGVVFNSVTAEEKEAFVSYISREKQKQAIAFFNEQLFTTPEWLLNRELFAKTGSAGMTGVITNAQRPIIESLIDDGVLSKQLQSQINNPKNVYAPEEMLADLRKGIFSELVIGKTISIYRRNLQKIYMDNMMRLIKPKGTPNPFDSSAMTDVSSIVKMEIKELHRLIKSAIPKTSDRLSKAHLIDLNERLNEFYKDTK